VLIASSKVEKAAWVRDIMLALFALGVKPSAALSLSPHEQRRLQQLAHSQQLGYKGRHHAHEHALTPVGDESGMGSGSGMGRDGALGDGMLVEYGQQRSVIKSGWLYKRGFVNQTWKRRWCVLMPNAILYYQVLQSSTSTVLPLLINATLITRPSPSSCSAAPLICTVGWCRYCSLLFIHSSTLVY
jgi:hypothetical protein